MGSELGAVCGECGETVTSATVEAHMDGHGRLLPSDWTLAAWPDGVQVLLDLDACSTCSGRGYIGAEEAAAFGRAPKCPVCDGTGSSG